MNRSFKLHRRIAGLALASILLVSPSLTVAAAGQPTDDSPWTDRILVQYESQFAPQAGDDLAQALSAQAGLPLELVRESSAGWVLKLPAAMSEADLQPMLAALAGLPGVAYAEPDSRVYPVSTFVNDPYYSWGQWNLNSDYGVNAEAAWAITHGSANVPVAVLDTGVIFEHNDLSPNLSWMGGGRGYDFIADVENTRDGDGRDANASDPGDWTETTSGALLDKSSWHGTHVSGIIGAVGNNGLGVAGLAWDSPILPARVLGTYGGYTSDIADAMRWAAGLPVAGVPAPAKAAKVLNLSLGGRGSCSITYQTAINDAVAAGALVVVAAGNETDDVSLYRPANCENVITVGANDSDGYLAYYSNYGTAVDISAPGDVYSTYDSSYTSPAFDSGYTFMSGTSMAAPHVSAALALMISANPALSQAQLLEIMQKTAQPFSRYAGCTTSTCGAGILDAGAAVTAAYNLAYVPSPSRLAPAYAGQGAATLPLRLRLSASAVVSPSIQVTLSNIAGQPVNTYTVLPANLTPVAGGGFETVLTPPLRPNGAYTLTVTLGDGRQIVWENAVLYGPAVYLPSVMR